MTVDPSQRPGRWSRWRAAARKTTANLTPQVVLEYPFEVIALVVALLMGLPFLIGITPPASLIAIVGHIAFYVWASALCLGSLTVAVGLQRRHRVITASGLQLLASGFAVYGVALVVVLGLGGWTGMVAYISLALVSLIRSVYFRRLDDIKAEARSLEDR